MITALVLAAAQVTLVAPANGARTSAPALAADAPRVAMLWPASDSVARTIASPQRGALAAPRTVIAARAAEGGDSGGGADGEDALADARRLADELRYEEAVVEYQRYLALPDRPTAERARAMFELAFIHLVLGDERSAQMRAQDAFELDPSLRLSADAPAKEQKFFEATRQAFESRTRLEILPPEDPAAPQRIRARLVDPRHNAHAVMLRHALAATGPFFGQTMACRGEVCEAEIPLPKDTRTLTVWYYVEANDAEGNTVARGGSTSAPLRVSIVNTEPWYRSPWVYAGGAAAVVTAAAIFFVASAPAK